MAPPCRNMSNCPAVVVSNLPSAEVRWESTRRSCLMSYGPAVVVSKLPLIEIRRQSAGPSRFMRHSPARLTDNSTPLIPSSLHPNSPPRRPFGGLAHMLSVEALGAPVKRELGVGLERESERGCRM